MSGLHLDVETPVMTTRIELLEPSVAQLEGQRSSRPAPTFHLQFCLHHEPPLSNWERDFSRSLVAQLRWSPRQQTKLADIAAAFRLRGWV